jgi:hypothetical protein
MLKRHPSGCPLCGQAIPTTHRGIFKVHEIPWEEAVHLRAGESARCRASGETPESVNRLLRTFEDEHNYSDNHYRPKRQLRQSVELLDNGDSLGIIATLDVGHEAASVCLDVRNEDLPRLRAEIDHIIAKRCLIPEEGK